MSKIFELVLIRWHVVETMASLSHNLVGCSCLDLFDAEYFCVRNNIYLQIYIADFFEKIGIL